MSHKVIALALLAACHRHAGPEYIPPAAEASHEPSVGRLDVALAGAMRAAYRKAGPVAPVRLAAAEGNELELREIVGTVAIDGVIAHTELRFVFHNPEPRVREGKSLALPEGAAIGRLAMKNPDGWHEGHVVGRTEGRQIFERSLHRRIDPALLEQDGGNAFSARVFPIAASSDKEIEIAFDTPVSASEPYVLPLAGLPRISRVSILVADGGAGKIVDEHDVAPGDVEVAIPDGAAAVAAGGAFVARVPVARDLARVDPLDSVVVLVDTSASRAPLMGKQADLVRELCAALPAETTVTVLAFDQTVSELYRGPAGAAGAIGDHVLEQGALGASDLGAALARAGQRAQRLIVIGDGMPTAGEADPAKLAELAAAGGFDRIDAIQIGSASDRDVLAPLVAAGKHAGTIERARSGAALVRAIGEHVPVEVAIAVEGATEVWPKTTRGLAPGEPVWVVGTRPEAQAGAPLAIHVGASAITVAPRTSDEPRIARMVARGEITALTEQMARAPDAERGKLAQQIEHAATAHGLLSSQTSLIVEDQSPTTTAQGITIDKSYLESVPVPGRTFEAALGAAAGSQSDDKGVAFSGSTSLENQYYVDGVNTTGLTYGTVGSPVGIQGEYGFNGPDGTGGLFHSDSDEPKYTAPYTGRLLDVMTAIAHRDRRRALSLAASWQLEAPGDLAALLALGEALEARGATVAAARAYGSLLDLYPKRAELLRAAGERLDRIPGARALAIDAYRRALRERPDQVSTYRLLAYDLMLDDQPEALDVLFEAFKHANRDSVTKILTADNHAVAAYLLAHVPTSRRSLAAIALGAQATPSLRVVLSWETDANDVDLHVRDGKNNHAFFSHRELATGGHLLDDLTDGYGPEMFEVTSPAAFPYHLGVNYYSRGPEGLGIGAVQVIRTDAAGNVTVETRPFVLQQDNAYIDLGQIGV